MRRNCKVRYVIRDREIGCEHITHIEYATNLTPYEAAEIATIYEDNKRVLEVERIAG